MVASKKKVKISKIKRNNQKRTKLAKQGKLKEHRHRNKSTRSIQKQNIERHNEHASDQEDSDSGEDLLQMVEKDDLDFLQSAISDKSYNLLRKIRLNDNEEVMNNKRRHKRKSTDEANDDALENEYENKILRINADENSDKNIRILLPVKTREGVVKKRIVEEQVNDEDDNIDEDENVADREVNEEVEPPSTTIAGKVSTVELLACRDQILKSKKLKIGLLASSLLENPQGESHKFKMLLDLLDERNPEVCITVKKLSMITLLEVFKDLLPSYHIHVAKEEGVKYKKETLELKNYEEVLLRSYRNYLQKLEKMAGKLIRKKGDTRIINEPQTGLALIAVDSLCQLMITHTYFNYSTNIVNFLIPLLNNRCEKARQTVLQCFSQVFTDDKRGEISLVIVKKLNQYIKKCKNSIHSECISVLLALKLKNINLDEEKNEEAKKKKLASHKRRILALSKRERKKNKKLEEIEKEMMETKATENKIKRQKVLTEVTSIVFSIYFRILKQEPNKKLLSVCLEGLAKFAECINFEFYQDIVNAITTIMKSDQELLGQREQLLCIQTVFTILSGQALSLNIDPHTFYNHFYKQLFNIHAGYTQDDCKIAIEVLHQVLINRRKTISRNRLNAFIKRSSTIALQMHHHATLGLLGIIKQVMQLDKNTDILLDTDCQSGDGFYQPELDEPEYSNAHLTAIWESVALQRHYHTIVQKYAKYIACGLPTSGQGTLPMDINKSSPLELYQNYDPTTVVFKPAVAQPLKTTSINQISTNFYFHNSQLEEYVTQWRKNQPIVARVLMDFHSALS